MEVTKPCPNCAGSVDPHTRRCPGCGHGWSTGGGAPTVGPPLPATDWVLTIGKTGEPIALEDNVPVELGREAADRRIRATMEHHWPDTGRHHAEITVRGRDLEVKDLDSKYGTFVYSDDRLPGEELQRLPRGGTAVVVLPITLRLAHSCYVRVRPR